MSERIAQRLAQPGPKRILALDGGGARGMISVGFLEHMEAALRIRHGRTDYVLADYYDLIGGTSVGSLLATMLAMGWPMDRVRRKFQKACPDIFLGGWLRDGWLRSRFSAKGLNAQLKDVLLERRLDSDDFVTGLAIVTKRLDTGSAWVVYNNPASAYWSDRIDPETRVKTVGNRHYRVADLVRASTAAPTYFKPHLIKIQDPTPEDDGRGLFVDGGLSPYNDPSLLLFMVAGLRGYRLGGVETLTDELGVQNERGLAWRLGPGNLLIHSVGTGDFRLCMEKKKSRIAIALGGEALRSMMSDNQAHSLAMMQWFSNPNRAWQVNGEIGDLADDHLGEISADPKSFLSYARYNIKLEPEWLLDHLGYTKTGPRALKRLRRIDEPKDLDLYLDLSRRAAKLQVTPDDFPWQFDNHKLG
jgi:hypothetical protein